LPNIQTCAALFGLSHFFFIKLRFQLLASAALLLTVHCMWASTLADDQSTKILLTENWQIQSSCEVKADGREISTVGFRADGCH
jgi:hypothetical protein